MNYIRSPEPQPLEALLTTEQVAGILGLSVETIATWRHTDRVKLPFVRIGGRLVRYRKADVDSLIAAGLQAQPATNET